MNTGCQQIDQILELSKSEGNAVREVSKWTKINKVIHMCNGLSSGLRDKIQSEIKGLEYCETKRTPFYPAHESFACNECSVAVEFPLKG